MTPGSPGWIRGLAAMAHRLIVAVPPLAPLYLSLWRRVAAGLSNHRRQQVLNSLATVSWPERALGPCAVTLASNTQIRLHPHNGEFDFAAVLGGRFQYEPEVFEFLDSRMDQYDAVIEIGANVGIFTVYFGKQLEGRGGRVYAFEPSSKAYARLLQNISVNQLSNVSSFAVAVGAATGFATFHEPEGHLTNGSLVSNFASLFSSKVNAAHVLVLNAASMVDLIEGPLRVLVKIDVEGFEAPLLRAISPFLQKVKPDVLLEVLPDFESAIEEAVRESAPDYLRFAITPQGLLPQEKLRALGGRDCFLVPSPKASAS